MLAGTLVAADDALDVLFGVNLGAAVAALRVGAVGLGTGRGATTIATRRAAQAAARLGALDDGHQIRAMAGLCGACVVCGCGAAVGAGQTGEILLDDVMRALVQVRRGGAQSGQILFDARRLLAGHAARRCAAPAAAATAACVGACQRAGSGRGMQMAA